MKKKTVIILSIFFACILVWGFWKYMGYKEYCKTHFPQNTIINQIDCSGMTTAEAKKILTDNWNEKGFTLTEEGKTLATLKDMNFTYAIDDALQEIMDKGHKLPLITTLFKRNDGLTISMKPAKWTKSFSNQISALPIYEHENPVTTKNAYVDMSDTKFNIVPEVYGNNIDKSKLKRAITKRIAEDTWELNYVEEDFYTLPTRRKDSEEILARQEYCKKYLSHKITYTFGSDSYTISPTELEKMMSANEEGKITVKKKQVEAFVSDLADKYNTVGTDRAFSSTARGTVIIDGGTYGYSIDESREVTRLTKNLKGQKDVTREPVYAQKGWGWENNGFGTTYIEVDLGSQHLWYYQNGNLVVDSPFVSGCVATKTPTVTGAFYLVYKAQDVTLRGGDKEDNTDYASEVSYWMPFYSDYGLHDASWRSDFGGDIYIKGGSHGCVNMPPVKAGILYNNISPGCPVIVFN